LQETYSRNEKTLRIDLQQEKNAYLSCTYYNPNKGGQWCSHGKDVHKKLGEKREESKK